MFRSLHALLVSTPVTRRSQRRLTRAVKRTCGVPDAYGDLFELARQHEPVAVLDIGAFHGTTVTRFLDELDWYARALREARDSRGTPY